MVSLEQLEDQVVSDVPREEARFFQGTGFTLLLLWDQCDTVSGIYHTHGSKGV